ncbi:hypothetical protein [Maricaulis maris]|uniref:M61 family metallopeptidase n=1 Tax=Maricaulis maris TaxID=74318 RepID=UPI003A8C89F6
MLHTLLTATGALAVIAMPVAANLSSEAEAPQVSQLRYRVEVSELDDATRVAVALGFVGEVDGTTDIVLPSNWGGEGELWTALGALQGRSASSSEPLRIEQGDDLARATIHHQPGEALALSYTITPDRTGEPQAALGDYYRPYVEPDWVHLIGQTIFAFPASDTEFDVTVALSAPDGWTLASDLEQGDLDINTLLTSVTVAGDFRVLEDVVDGAAQRVAIRGGHAFTDTDMSQSVRAVLAANAAYWGTGAEPFLVTVLPLEADPGVMSVGGTNLGDAFAFFATNNAESDILLRILVHEHVHTWIPGRVGGSINGETEPAGYWFSEGFTDFLTQRAAVRAGLWSAETAIASWNEALLEDFNSPVRDAPNDAVISGFWTDPDFQRLPYHRGMIFAALVDHTIRSATSGRLDLDDVLLDMQTDPPSEPAPLSFAGRVLAITGVDIAPLVERHMINGEPISLPAETFGACGPVEMISEPVFVYGMTGQRNADDRYEINTVDPDGPAAPAGFRPGMVILERLEGAVGNAMVDSVLRVATPEGETLDLRYRPTNGELQTYPRISTAAGDLASNGCAARIGGL